MADIRDIGQYIVELYDGIVDKHRLAKLCYFTQGWHLAWTGSPITESPFQAWKYGPVPTKLGPASIEIENSFNVKKISRGDASRLTEYERAVIEEIIDFYGNKSFNELTELSHGRAWQEARRGLPSDERSNEEITLDSMLKEFSILIHETDNIPQAPDYVEAFDFNAALISAEQVEADWKETFHLLATR